MSMFRRSVSEADNSSNADVQHLPTSPVQSPPPTEERPDSEASTEEKTFEDRLKEVTDGVTAASDYRRRLAREDPAVSNLIQDLEEYVEQLSTIRSKFEEDAARIGTLCERFEYETAEVDSLRAQIKEQVARIRTTVNSGETKPENDKLDEPQLSDQ
jgi:uncharacterized coiled-coil DUF342 family protein